MDEQLIRIGLKYAGTVYDLQVSKKTTLKVLAEQLRPALAVVKVELPARFELHLLNKALTLDENVPLQAYPLGDGDQFEVSVRKENDADK